MDTQPNKPIFSSINKKAKNVARLGTAAIKAEVDAEPIFLTA